MSSLRPFVVACALALLVCGLAALPVPTPPASAALNDNLANAIEITPPLYSGIAAVGDNVGATIEGSEVVPSCHAFGKSTTVWFKWTPPANTYMGFDTFGSNFDTLLAIYSGPSMTQFLCNDDFGGAPQSAVRKLFQGNTTYYIQVGGKSGATGNVVLNTSKGRTMLVTLNDDSNNSDTYLTLREALLVSQQYLSEGNLGRELSAAEKALILGTGPGELVNGNPADIIHFSPNQFYPTSPQFISIGSTLPLVSDAGNTISGLGAGVIIDGQNLNFHCLDITGASNNVEGLEFRRCKGNTFPAAVRTSGSTTVIGGIIHPGQSNTFVQNSVAIAVTPPGQQSKVIGNFIGMNAAGTISQNQLGIAVTGAFNQIGGIASVGEGNLLGGSQYEQIVIRGAGANSNTVRGNRIGAFPGGTGAWGIRIDTQAQNNTIGGMNSWDANWIGNAGNGIRIESGPNVVQGNKIGTDVFGIARPNGTGVYIVSPATQVTVGGNVAGTGNMISGNTNYGVLIENANGNNVQGNYIGTDATGTVAVANAYGVGLYNAAGNTVGGTGLARNVISGNTSDGVQIDNSTGNNATANTLLNNVIGMNATATGALGNGGHGVNIVNSAGQQIGSATSGLGNIIAFNGGPGVRVEGGSSPAAVNNTIRGNSIHDNLGPGIDLVTGGNNNLAAPIFTGTTVSGTACANCTIDVYSDADNADEGRDYHGSTTAGPGGAWTYFGAVTGPNVTATATNAAGDTSEFSAPLDCPGGTCSVTPSPSPSPSPTATGQTATPTSTPQTPTATVTPIGQTPSATPTGTAPGTPSQTPDSTATTAGATTPASSATVTPVGSVTATAGPSGTPVLIQGDIDCDGDSDDDDWMALLMFLAGFAEALQPGCEFELGEEFASQHFWGDADCDSEITVLDVLAILRESGGVPLPVATTCPGVGEPVQV